MEIVVNEWLLDYSLPGSSKEEKELLQEFLSIWIRKSYIAVIKIPSPFSEKFKRYFKSTENDINCKNRFNFLYHSFWNSDRTKIIYDSEVQFLTSGIDQKVPLDDRYLFELIYSTESKILVTTDKRLKEIFKDEQDFKIYLLEEFIATFK